ncbi:MAG: 5'-nucleotidase C-terminal domain-containing protein [Rikenellaceae bacterium]
MYRLIKLGLLFKLGLLLALFAFVFLSQSCHFGSRDKTFVILSTNDMHAQIDKFPALATAIELCRDTVDVILVDAGDRWTGNAYVDLVEHYTPIYELMNHLDYDVTIYGNHEFDKGQAYLATSNRQAQFPIIGANILSDTTTFPQPAPHYIVEVEGKKIAFVGVVGNYEANGHPSGKDESYEGLTFSDPHTTAAQYSYLAEECDMLVLVSHCGLERDVEFAQSPLSEGYDHIISAHSHDTAIETIGGKLISQTGSRLKNIGATTVTITKRGEIKLSHCNVPLADYAPDAAIAQIVDNYYHNPTLNAPIGSASQTFMESGVRNLFAETIRKRVAADVGIYHAGGVRIDTIPEGEISMATVLNAEPFNSYIATATMSCDELKSLIMAKFNDKLNVGESHYIDIIATTPYVVLTGADGDAVDVIFPELDPEKRYVVAMGDYIFKTYSSLNYSKGGITETLITTTLEEHIKKLGVITPNEQVLQSIEPQ